MASVLAPPILSSTDDRRLPELSDVFLFDVRLAYTLHRDDRVVMSCLLQAGLRDRVVPKVGQPQGEWRRISKSASTREAKRASAINQILLPEQIENGGLLLLAQLHAAFGELAPRWSTRSISCSSRIREWSTVKLRALIEVQQGCAKLKGSALVLKSSAGLILYQKRGRDLPSLDDGVDFEDGSIDTDCAPTEAETEYLRNEIKRRLGLLSA